MEKKFLHESFAFALLMVLIGGFAFCATMNAHHGVMDMKGMASCNTAHFASALLPPKISDKTSSWLVIGLLSLVMLSLRRVVGRFVAMMNGFLEKFSSRQSGFIMAAIRDPILEVLRRGIMHPKLYNASPVS